MPMLDVEDARLHYAVRGQASAGTTVLLTAGYGVPSRLWGPLVPALAERFRVVTHDVRGFGETELSTESTNLEQLADDLHALVEEIGGPVVSLGHAFGGAIAQRHAVKHAADVSALVICSSGNVFPSEPEAAAGMLPLATKRDLDAEGYAELFVRTYCGPAYGRTDEERAWLDAMFETSQTREQARVAVSALGTLDGETFWGLWEQPALLIYGSVDRIAVPLNAFDLARRPNARLEWLRGAGHFAPVEQPDRTASLVTSFVEDLQRSRPWTRRGTTDRG